MSVCSCVHDQSGNPPESCGTCSQCGKVSKPEAARRAQCRAEGHEHRTAEHEPVIPSMVVCRRCGRYARTHEELEAMR